MSIPLARRVQRLEPSATFRLARRAQELRDAGKDVVSFGLGEPDFDTPEPARRAAHEAIESGKTHYTANEGIGPLRRAIVEAFAREQGVRYDPAREVLVTAGAKQALAHAILALVDEGDEVLVPSPYWLTYPELVRFAGGVCRLVPARLDHEFRLDVADLAAAVSPRTRLLVLNSPNNPTGAVLDEEALAGFGRFVLEHDLWVLSDEIYGSLVYGGRRHRSIAGVDEALRARTIVCHGMSKAYAMTGWRLGYALGPAEVIEPMATIQGHTTSNACSISQYAAVAALEQCADDRIAMHAEFARRRDFVLERLGAMPGLQVPVPDGAFYVFPRVAGLYGRTSQGGVRLADSNSFCEALLNEALVSLVPGAVFGADDCVRLSYAASLADLERGLERIAHFVQGLQ